MGALNIPNPTKNSDVQYSGSRKISAPLTSLIEQQSDDFYLNPTPAKSDIRKLKHQHLSSLADSVNSRLTWILYYSELLV